MHRFHLPTDQCRASTLILAHREAHHAQHVLRLRKRDPVEVLDGNGARFLCEVKELGRNQVEFAVLRQESIPPPQCRITLLQGLPKGRIFESIIQKATELGALRIVPLLTERVATRLDDAKASHKAGKWQLTAVEAIKQCGAAWLPRIEPPLTPAQFLARREEFDLALVASLQQGGRPAKSCFNVFTSERGTNPKSVAIWIGPEGDFTPAEVAAVVASGAQPISLGPLVLRCETAAVYCLSIVNHEVSPAPAGQDAGA